jgi:hypothetical protein
LTAFFGDFAGCEQHPDQFGMRDPKYSRIDPAIAPAHLFPAAFFPPRGTILERGGSSWARWAAPRSLRNAALPWESRCGARVYALPQLESRRSQTLEERSLWNRRIETLETPAQVKRAQDRICRLLRRTTRPQIRLRIGDRHRAAPRSAVRKIRALNRVTAARLDLPSLFSNQGNLIPAPRVVALFGGGHGASFFSGALPAQPRQQVSQIAANAAVMRKGGPILEPAGDSPSSP